MTPTGKTPEDTKRKDSPPELPDLRSEWADENVEIEGRKPDLSEIDEDTEEL